LTLIFTQGGTEKLTLFFMRIITFFKSVLTVLVLAAFFVFSTRASAQTWQQVGIDIVGEAASDPSGQSVSLSADGSTMAIGATENNENGINAGQVRAFSLTPACKPINPSI
jgi:hypothetical protein